jgi:hypothetical protein
MQDIRQISPQIDDSKLTHCWQRIESVWQFAGTPQYLAKVKGIDKLHSNAV